MTVLPSPIPHPLDYCPFDVPGWAYEALEWVVGFDWPAGDEAATWDVADRWFALGGALAEPREAASAAAVQILSGYGGTGITADGFRAAWDELAADENAPLNALVQIAHELGDLVEECGRDIEAAKLEAWIEIGLFLIELTGLAVAVTLTLGAASPAAGGLIAATRIAVQQIFRRLVEQLGRKAMKQAGARAVQQLATRQGLSRLGRKALREGADEFTDEAVTNAGIQLYQQSTGRADGMDWGDLGMSAAAGLAGGTAAGGAHLGARGHGGAFRGAGGEVLAEFGAAALYGDLPDASGVAKSAGSGGVGGGLHGVSSTIDLAHLTSGRFVPAPADLHSGGVPMAGAPPPTYAGPLSTEAGPITAGATSSPELPSAALERPRALDSLFSVSDRPPLSSDATSPAITSAAPGTADVPDGLPTRDAHTSAPALATTGSPGLAMTGSPSTDLAAPSVAASTLPASGPGAAAGPAISSTPPVTAPDVTGSPPAHVPEVPRPADRPPLPDLDRIAEALGPRPAPRLDQPLYLPLEPDAPAPTWTSRPVLTPVPPRGSPPLPGRAFLPTPLRDEDGYFGYADQARRVHELNRRDEYVAYLTTLAEESRGKVLDLGRQADEAFRVGSTLLGEHHRRGATQLSLVIDEIETEIGLIRAGELAPDVIDVGPQEWARINDDVGVLAPGGVRTDERSALTGSGGGLPIDRTRRYNTYGGLRPPLAVHQADLENAVPRDGDGHAQRLADPRVGTWFTLANDGGPAADPTRGINCLDSVLALYDTYMHGRPRVSAPRTFDAYAHGDPNRPVGGELAGVHRIQLATGSRFQNLCPYLGGSEPARAKPAMDLAIRNLTNQLHNRGHGAFAFLLTELEGGGCHCWAAINQNGTILFLDPQVGRIAEDTPMYRHEGVPAPANLVSMDALVVDGRGEPAPLPFHEPSQWDTWAQPTGNENSTNEEAERLALESLSREERSALDNSMAEAVAAAETVSSDLHRIVAALPVDDAERPVIVCEEHRVMPSRRADRWPGRFRSDSLSARCLPKLCSAQSRTASGSQSKSPSTDTGDRFAPSSTDCTKRVTR